MKARTYRQRARAVSTEGTRTAILDAVDRLFLPHPAHMLSLDQVAGRAGTTVQTVLRHFGSKGGLFEAASRRGYLRVKADRDRAPAGDLRAIVSYLSRHYEDDAATVLRMLAVEDEIAEVGEIVRRGRKLHLAWVERVFEPFLRRFKPQHRKRQVACLVAATDILTWKVLRLEQGLSRRDYEHCIFELLEALR
jgi:AcrR family transcriptional regulator